MREAWHTNNKRIYLIPQDLSEHEVENHKQIAKKGTFTCPYCEAKLIVKSGDIHGNYFSHQHGEGCEPSKQSETRYKKYEKQKKNETLRQSVIRSLMYNEFEVLSKVYPYLTSSYGFLNHEFNKYIPDISLKINEQKYAITVFTNISSSKDMTIANSINRQKQYYEALGYNPLFFIERSNVGIDIDNQSLVLWATEREALTTQLADIQWQEFLSILAPSEELQQILNVPRNNLNVKSIMYITPANEDIAIEVFHVLEQPNTSPVKAYFLCDPYKLSFAKAFELEDDTLTLADIRIEIINQSKYAERFEQARIVYIEHLKEQERKRIEMEKQQRFEEEQRRKHHEEKRMVYQESINNSTYKNSDKARKLELLKRSYGMNN